MGTTLGNIHIYGQISDTLIDALAEQYCISTSCANWISLYSMDFQTPEWLCAETARISNMVSAPVLAFYCFDDAAATVTLYKNGNNMAECGASAMEEFEPTMQELPLFATEFGIDDIDAKRLRYILDSGAEITSVISLLEEYFGVCLFADEDLIEALEERDRFLHKERGRVLYETLIGKQ